MVKRQLYISVIILIIITIFYIAPNLKSDKKLVLARPLMLSCENCYRLEVIASNDKNLISQIIIPESVNYNVEGFISEPLKDKQNYCLEGYTYIFNLPVYRVDPPVTRFEIDKSYPLSECRILNNKKVSPEHKKTLRAPRYAFLHQ